MSDDALLRRVAEAFAAVLDRQDGAAAADLFAPEGRMVVLPPPPAPPAVHTGRAAITTLIDALGRYDRTDHRLGAHVSLVDGDRAFSVTRCEAHHVAPGADGEVDRVVVIAYHDAARWADGRWALEERIVRMEREVHVPVAAGQRFAVLPPG